jgi:hypothetical protein
MFPLESVKLESAPALMRITELAGATSACFADVDGGVGAIGATGAEGVGVTVAAFFSPCSSSAEAHPAKTSAATIAAKRQSGERIKEVAWFILLFGLRFESGDQMRCN